MDRDFNEILRHRISQVLDEPIDEGIDADDLMFDLGMRYLRRMEKEKRKRTGRKKAHQLTLWAEDAPSKKALVE